MVICSFNATQTTMLSSEDSTATVLVAVKQRFLKSFISCGYSWKTFNITIFGKFIAILHTSLLCFLIAVLQGAGEPDQTTLSALTLKTGAAGDSGTMGLMLQSIANKVIFECVNSECIFFPPLIRRYTHIKPACNTKCPGPN